MLETSATPVTRARLGVERVPRRTTVLWEQRKFESACLHGWSFFTPSICRRIRCRRPARDPPLLANAWTQVRAEARRDGVEDGCAPTGWDHDRERIRQHHRRSTRDQQPAPREVGRRGTRSDPLPDQQYRRRRGPLRPGQGRLAHHEESLRAIARRRTFGSR